VLPNQRHLPAKIEHRYHFFLKKNWKATADTRYILDAQTGRETYLFFLLPGEENDHFHYNCDSDTLGEHD
jgi:hypothetical protein